jgi:hypothetical protein
VSDPAGRSGLPALRVEWRRLLVDGRTCERCGQTGGAVERAVERARLESGLEVELVVVALGPERIDESNLVTVDGVAIEALLGALPMATACDSCSDLTGDANCVCRAVDLDGRVFEALDEEMILRAILIAAKNRSRSTA